MIHYEDLLLVVNELFAAGAEAVSINGQRIITTSEILLRRPYHIGQFHPGNTSF